MNKIIKLTETEKSIFHMERAIADLRNGFPVVYRPKDSKGWLLFFATENLTNDTFFAIKEEGFFLSLSKARVKYLTSGQYDEPLTLSLIDKSFEEIAPMIESDIEHLAFPFEQLLANNIGNFDNLNLIHRMLQLSELAPSIVGKYIDITEAKSLEEFSVVSDHDVENYLHNYSSNLRFVNEARLHIGTQRNAKIRSYRATYGGKEHYAIIIGEPHLDQHPLVRIHSSCFTGDLLGSKACDCGEQLKGTIALMDSTQDYHGGVIIYLIQEGRGIGLINKLRTYNLQEKGLDTVEANNALGFSDDLRLFLPAVSILKELALLSITLVTNNPKKIGELQTNGITVAHHINLAIEPNQFNSKYLKTKIDKMGHIIPFSIFK